MVPLAKLQHELDQMTVPQLVEKINTLTAGMSALVSTEDGPSVEDGLFTEEDVKVILKYTIVKMGRSVTRALDEKLSEKLSQAWEREHNGGQ